MAAMSLYFESPGINCKPSIVQLADICSYGHHIRTTATLQETITYDWPLVRSPLVSAVHANCEFALRSSDSVGSEHLYIAGYAIHFWVYLS